MMKVQENRARLDRLRAIGAMTASLAHEFATPLNTIKMRVDRIERNQLRDLSDNLTVTKSAIEQCEQSLRSMISTEINAEDLRIRPVNISHLLQALIQEWKTENNRPNLTLGIQEDCKNLSAEVAVAPLGQAIFDLLDNASQSSEHPQVKVSLRRESHQLVCSIDDNGRGFPESVLNNFGKSFVTTKPDGTGLGISNAVQIFESLGGSLSAQNLPNQGARVVWTLPIMEAA